ncbi:SMC-Scp complex subunit ScpB [Halomonas shantousis]
MVSERDAGLDEILEAALLAAGEPVSLERLETLFDEGRCPPRRELREALEALEARLSNSALELIESASGYQLRIRQRLSPWVSRLWDERPQRYSRALLETLALIAYRQPVTRGDIEEVRGVAVSSSIMRTLGERGWIRVVGHRDVPGRPAVYATTRQFLDDFGLKTLDALPPMHELNAFEALEAQFDESLPEPARTLRDQSAESDTESGADTGPTSDTTAGMADVDSHAGTASERSGLSFADLEARLAERARQQTVRHEDIVSTDDEAADTAHPSDENTSES